MATVVVVVILQVVVVVVVVVVSPSSALPAARVCQGMVSTSKVFIPSYLTNR